MDFSHSIFNTTRGLEGTECGLFDPSMYDLSQVVAVATDLGNTVQVSNHVSKAEHGAGAGLSAEARAQFTAASALTHLRNKQYKAAARKFIEVPPLQLSFFLSK